MLNRVINKARPDDAALTALVDVAPEDSETIVPDDEGGTNPSVNDATPSEDDEEEAEIGEEGKPTDIIAAPEENHATVDNTPPLHSVTASVTATHTYIIARVFDPEHGWVNRSHTTKSPISAREMGDAIATAGSW